MMNASPCESIVATRLSDRQPRTSRRSSLHGSSSGRSDAVECLGSDEPRRLIGESPEMTQLLDLIARIASKNVTVLIEGDTGTGKELVAREIHRRSPRCNQPFVAVNCAEIGTDAAESRLFGHRRGSFTGAIEDHKGFFEAAEGGTLLLDEVGELAPPIQGKLLRALQEREILRFGESRPRKVDVRVLAATNRHLDREVEAGRFREDLLFRLKVLPIRVPPLHERRGDVVPLAKHFLEIHARRIGMPVPELREEALTALALCEFPGNVRELEHAIIRALVLLEPGHSIGLDTFPAIAAAAIQDRSVETAATSSLALPEVESLPAAVARYERHRIERALNAAQGNRTRAARVLGISRRWLFKKLASYERDTGGRHVSGAGRRNHRHPG
jgi:transcriptional regulator with GAF, ATPase, and Fis domain